MTRLKKFVATAFGAALMLAASGARADDTDIFFQTGIDGGGAPLVIFYLQYTSELNSTLCTGVPDRSMMSFFNGGCFDYYLAGLAKFFADRDFDDQTITRFEVIRAVIKRVLAGLGGLKVGIMLGHDDVGGCDGPGDNAGCSNGGYILKGVTLLEEVPKDFDIDVHDLNLLYYDNGVETQKKVLFDALDAIPAPQGNVSHKNQNKEVYFELFRYLTGGLVHNGHNGWADFGTDGVVNLGNATDIADSVPNGTVDLKWDTSVESGESYVTPLVEDCSKVFVINVVKGKGNQADDSDAAIGASLSDGGMGFAVSNSDTGFVEMVRWLRDKDLADGTINGLNLVDRQNVTSFFFADITSQMDAAAIAGGTGEAIPLSDDPAQLVRDMSSVFDQVLSVSTTFVSASIPVNVFNRAEVMDNVYVALFQTDPDNSPQWLGNLKKLKLSVTTVNAGLDNEYQILDIVDAHGNKAIASDGRIRHDALTFWTEANSWEVSRTYTDSEVVSKDGRSLNRGGAGQQIAGFLDGDSAWTPGVPSLNNDSGRQLFTERVPDSAAAAHTTTMMDLDADMATAELLWPYLLGDASAWADDSFATGSVPPTKDTTWADAASIYLSDGTSLQEEAVNVLKFIRGQVKALHDVEPDTQVDDIVRRWLVGDPLHSRPLPLSYGAPSGYSEDNPDIRIIIGGNDGLLRMVRNISGASGDSPIEDGSETWGFMPLSMLSIQKQLMDNDAGTGHPYGVDGPPMAYIYDKLQDGTIDPSEDKVYAYFGMRRGGHSYFGLNLSAAASPEILWTIDNTTTGFEELGMTFSAPQVRMLQWGSYTAPRPVLVFGGGYDIDKDTISPDSSYRDDEGAAIFIVDAETGDLVWKAVWGSSTGSSSSTVFTHAELDDSIPSDVTAVDTDANGSIDRLYVGDTGGRIWRGDFPGTDRSQWKLTEILSVGRHSSSGDDRRFFHAPDFVPARQWDDATNAFVDYDAILIGSGNRASPLSNDYTDWFYLYKDFETVTGTAPGSVTDHSELGDVTDDCWQYSTGAAGCTTAADLAKGWKLGLPDPGEKILSAPLTYKGIIYFTSYVPTLTGADACGPSEGKGYSYAVSFEQGKPVFNFDTSTDQLELRREMDSKGIPSDPVFIRYKGLEGVMTTDFDFIEEPGNTAWRTYWYSREE